MKNAFLALLLLVPLALTVSARTPGQTAGGQTSTTPQLVKLSVGDKGYVVTPATVTKGVPVKMEVDLDTVKGCARTVVISTFDVKKTVKTGDNTIEFTPDKTGEIEIACGMNMLKGSFKVAETR